jgi:hypothetical protein
MRQTVPFLQLTLSYMCRSPTSAPGSHIPEPSDECRRKFEQWWSLQLTQQQQQHQHHGPQHHPMPRPQSGSQYSPGGSSHHTSTPNKLLERPPSLPESVHPALQVSDLLAYSSQSRSHITTGNQSVSPSWCQAPIWDPRPVFLSPGDYLLDSYYLLFCSALSDERMGL